MLSLIFAAVVAGPLSYFVAPPGWVGAPTPELADIGIVAIWQPARRNGQNIALSVRPHTTGESLGDAVASLISEEQVDERTIVSVRSHATCGAKQAGTDVDMRFGPVSQFYHVAVTARHVYALIYTHSAGGPVDASIMRAFDSFCPP